MCSVAALRSDATQDRSGLDVLWETLSDMELLAPLGLTLLLRDEVHVHVRLRESGARVWGRVRGLCRGASSSWEVGCEQASGQTLCI